MRVDELIELLKTLPQDMLVWKSKDDEGNGYNEVDGVEGLNFIRTDELEQYEVEEVYSKGCLEELEILHDEVTEVAVIW